MESPSPCRKQKESSGSTPSFAIIIPISDKKFCSILCNQKDQFLMFAPPSPFASVVVCGKANFKAVLPWLYKIIFAEVISGYKIDVSNNTSREQPITLL
ncbi:hypothetical protein M8C21_032342 [Ambrosia artemisiifolia]|uniref:Uncharacterized protein n=1 Tax=Ambrosia artemisiifolia TaxID=4212 RepID=A0AAD5CAG7_AMBAR|nr:hypothetical protein M8C21_032342 [Ambrosia artemisiifolia]